MLNFTDYLFESSGDLGTKALVYNGGEDSFADLSSRVLGASRHLAQAYSQKSLIGIYSTNSPFFVENYLSIVGSGNVAVFLDIRMPSADMSKLVDHHQISALLAEPRHSKRLRKTLRTDIPIVSHASDISPLNTQGRASRRRPLPEELALVIFTSGSSGDRKGVMLTHRNLVANTESILKYLNISANDRMNVILPFSYSYGLSLLNTHLRVGASLYLHNSPHIGSIISELEEYKCTGLAGVPSTFQILLKRTPFLTSKLHSLRYLTVAGGKLDEKYVKQMTSSLHHLDFYIMYGATEATARMSYLSPELVGRKPGSIGKAIDGVTLELVGEGGGSVSEGEIGEIVARGQNIMLGYLDDPGGTRQVLSDGRYSTGDLARRDEDGDLYIVDRKNSLIKSMGFRVSPLAVERVLRDHPLAESAVVFGAKDDAVGEIVMTVVQPSSGTNTEELKRELLDHCHKRLASFEVPQRIEFVESLPLTSAGKVDLTQLKKRYNTT
jgi:long-chain acyl-CoA synthetase